MICGSIEPYLISILVISDLEKQRFEGMRVTVTVFFNTVEIGSYPYKMLPVIGYVLY